MSDRPKRILFVCSGNSCRSAMAEGLARILADRFDLDMEFSSAGTLGSDGAPASPEAVAVAAELGADISSHRSRTLSPEIVRRADIIFGMEYAHLESVKAISAGRARVALLGDAEIPDPIGRDQDFYRAVRDEIWTSLERILPEIDDEI